MPLCTLYLISLTPETNIPSFLFSLSTQSPPIHSLVASRVIRWIITPTTINASALLDPPHPWDLLLLLPSTDALPTAIKSQTRNLFALKTGIPSRLLADFESKNATLLHPTLTSIPPISPQPAKDSSQIKNDSQSLTLSSDLLSWASNFATTHPGRSTVSMLNLLAFHKTEAAKQSYLAYGAAFAKSIGSRHGGNAKIVGHAVYLDSSESKDQSDWLGAASGGEGLKWDEIAIAQYPTIAHFTTMLGSKDYQEVNAKYRVPSLRDTCILCTSEIAVEEEVRKYIVGGGGGKGVGTASKL